MNSVRGVGLLALCVMLGCGGGGPQLATVTGTIKLNGSPLANASVTFQPQGTDQKEAPTSVGTTDAQGKYELSIPTTGVKGAVVGNHKVLIVDAGGAAGGGDSDASTATGKDEPQGKVPAKYNTDSTLSFEVKAGANTADFELTVP